MISQEYLPFFVYGTLRREQHNYNFYFESKTESEYNAWIKGILYNFGQLPAYKPEGDNWIKGDLIYVNEKLYDNILTDIDFLEGYEPYSEETSLYIRRKRKILREDRQWIDAWIYIFNYPVSEKLLSEIPSGDWNKQE